LHAKKTLESSGFFCYSHKVFLKHPRMSSADTIKNITKDLIRFRSTDTNQAERKQCLDYIEEFFEGSGFTIHRHGRHGVESLFVSRGNKRPHFLLYGHYDVVEGDDDQFFPHERDGCILGRGSFDMKSGLAVFMNIMKHLPNKRDDIGFIVVGDEEQGGSDGAAFMTEEGYGGGVVLMPDGGMQIDRIIEKEKGVMRFTLTATGVPAHSAMRWNGEHAIDKLIAAITKIQTIFPPESEHPDNHWVDTISVGTIKGGRAVNQIPEYASAFIEVRMTEKTDGKQLLAHIKQTAGSLANVEYEFGTNASLMGSDSRETARFINILKTRGHKPTHSVAHGSSDARYFTESGASVIMCQPKGGNHHGKNEWVDVKALLEYDSVVREFLKL
jgi:succinyl-diaminopimelate desuccinylase